jgi:hypothetical protein
MFVIVIKIEESQLPKPKFLVSLMSLTEVTNRDRLDLDFLKILLFSANFFLVPQRYCSKFNKKCIISGFRQ